MTFTLHSADVQLNLKDDEVFMTNGILKCLASWNSENGVPILSNSASKVNKFVDNINLTRFRYLYLDIMGFSDIFLFKK